MSLPCRKQKRTGFMAGCIIDIAKTSAVYTALMKPSHTLWKHSTMRLCGAIMSQLPKQKSNMETYLHILTLKNGISLAKMFRVHR